MSTQTPEQGICQESQNVTVDLDASVPINHQSLLATILTFGISAFHASRSTKGSAFAPSVNVPVWEAVRCFDSILLAALVAALFKESAQLDPIYWFFVTCSLLQASMGLICSTILIILFSGGSHHQVSSLHIDSEYRSVREDQLRLLFWNIWDQFSLPAVSTVWSVLTFMIALIMDAVWPINAVPNDCLAGRAHRDTQFTVAKTMLLLVLCFTAVRFGIFMAHLRRTSRALGRLESVV
ncbi:hypothetical protein F5887DRAFT_364563 [Amanita rubescens]|nr:hypothetical protein F5887DRAFT_364563 [Amanita rubescens]